MVLGLFERDGSYISGAEDSATFDGKTLGEFLRSDYDYFEGNNRRGGGFSGRDPKDLFVDSLITFNSFVFLPTYSIKTLLSRMTSIFLLIDTVVILL